MRKPMIAALAALALAAAPPAVAARGPAPAAPAAATQVEPASETVQGEELLGKRGFILPLILVVGIVVALLLLVKDEHQEIPTSP